MVDPTSQIVHESETQRQFIRLQLPAYAEIDGRRYTVKDLSSGGLAIRDIDRPLKRGERLTIKLVLPFADFALDVDLNAEVQFYDKKLQLAGCRFAELTPRQIGILTHVIKSFMAGDIIQGSDVLNVASRDPFVNIRKQASNEDKSKWQTVRQFSIYGLITTVCLALAFFISGNILERLYVLESANGVVKAETVTVAAPTEGLFSPSFSKNGANVNRGQIIGRIISTTLIETPDGRKIPGETAVRSPCDCYIAETNGLAGEYKAQNAPLYTLIPRDQDIYVSTLVNMEDSHRLEVGTKVILKISGSTEKIGGTVTDIRAEERQVVLNDMEAAVPAAAVQIKPDTKLIINHIDRPVFVEFHL